MNTEVTIPVLARLLAQACLDPDVTRIEMLAQGGNNRTWRVHTAAGPYVAKQYFRHADDTRDRLRAEFDFVRYASALMPGRLPQALARDEENGLALYSFVPGNVLRPGEIAAQDVVAAADFFRVLNQPRNLSAAAHLPQASEACFSLDAHLDLIGRRIERLREAGEVDAVARDFLQALWQRWDELTRELRDMAAEAGMQTTAVLPQAQRCVSPSDFGFHNALRDEAGNLRFLDFEYAGWDDPAKMIGDFFAQLAVPVPAAHFDAFARGCLRDFPESETLLMRAMLLRPVYQIKWCCIALNVFLPVHLARRKFSNPDLDETALKRAQLAKAEALFHSLKPLAHGLH